MSALELRADRLGVDIAGRRILHEIDLIARGGEPIALTGPSGSGKTALLHALAGLLPATSGTVSLDGRPLTGDLGTRGTVGVVLQTHGLAAGLTAEENVALPLQERGLDRRDIAERCREALDAVGLEGAAGRMVDDLSGGQRQRVGVARALAGRPDVILADEPTAELDPQNRALVLPLLFDLSSRRIVVIASNDPDVADACRSVVHLRDGRIHTDA